MNSCINTLKYMSKRFLKSYLILFAILLAIVAFSKIMGLLFAEGSQGNNTFDAVFLIYAFVYFIAMFKESFNHLSMSGITRKTYFISNIVYIVFVSFVMVISAIVFAGINELVGIHSELVLQMAYHCSILEFVALGICLTAVASLVGWLCSLLTYRFGNYMILIIIFVPQILITIFGALVSKANKAEELLHFVLYYFGMTNGLHPFVASFNLLITAAVIAVINWLFMRKLPVKV